MSAPRFINSTSGRVLSMGFIVVGLWVNGRYWRSHWDGIATIHKRPSGNSVTNTTAYVFVPGAFNVGPMVSTKLAPLWGNEGNTDVFVVEYTPKRFNLPATVEAIDNAIDGRYQAIILNGASMGGIVCLELLRFWKRKGRKFPGGIYLIGCSVPQWKKHISWAARLLHFVHPGPVTNLLLSRLIGRVMFRVQSELLERPGVDTDALEANIAAMQSAHECSAMADHVRTILLGRLGTPDEFPDVRAWHVRVTNDSVIKGKLSGRDWFIPFPNSAETVIDAFHAGYIEDHLIYKKTFRDILGEIYSLIAARRAMQSQ